MLYRRALSICTASALLAACGASQPPFGAPGAMPQSRTVATHADRGGSWMLPEAKRDALLYVTDSTENVVDVYSYPAGKLVGFNGPQGERVDAKGDVFVTDQNSPVAVLEYAHGGIEPINKLRGGIYQPFGCSVDPVAGDLAVTNGAGRDSYSLPSNVAIYHNAAGKPRYHRDHMDYFYASGYDAKGNLFADAYDYSNKVVLVELRKGARTFASITLDQQIHDPGGVLWDGTYLTVGDRGDHGAPHGHSWIYRFRVTGKRGTEVSVTLLRHDTYAEQYWIQGSRVVAGDDNLPDDVYAWSYPNGGLPVRRIGGVTRPLGVTVSAAPSR